ncbi:MAG: hypothetical protein E7262_06965 [Lachnospiraceae bacterium]|nr:hypothetical protein [Lachnospiraceae bacterium]
MREDKSNRILTGWMIYNLEDYKKNEAYYNMHKEKGVKYNLDIQLILVECLSFGIKNNRRFVTYNGEDIHLPDFVIMRSRYSLISKQLELLDIPVYNNSFVSEICNNKAKAYQLLSNNGIDIIDTEFVSASTINQYIYNNVSNQHMESDASIEDKIIKSVDGHGGTEVYLLKDYIDLLTHNNKSNATCTINNVYDNKSIGHNITNQTDLTDNTSIKNIQLKDMVIQPLIKGDNKDVRVYVLNNKIIGAVLRQGKNSFKSNYSLGGEVSLYNLSPSEVSIVNKIISIFNNYTKNYYIQGLFYVGIDFIIDDSGKFLFNEIEDVVGSRMLYQVSDIDIVDVYLKEIQDRLKLQ